MATQTMKVTSRQAGPAGSVRLVGTPIAPSVLVLVSARLATTNPPAPDKATGVLQANAAEVKLGATIWGQVTLGNLAFTLTVTHTNGVVSDVDASNFGQPLTAADPGA